MEILEMEIINDDGMLESEVLNDDKPFDSYVNFKGEYINTLTKEHIDNAVAEYFKQNDVTPKAKIKEITLFADKWIGEDPKYEQIIEIDGITRYSQVDLKPSDEQLEVFYDKKVMLTTKNIDGEVTVILIGQKLTNDYIIQVTITEVEYE